MAKNAYRVRNWKDYNKSLVRRGSIELWFSPDLVLNWNYQGKRAPGGVKQFSDEAIKACLIIKEVYRLSFRQSEGLVRSIAKLFHIKKVPSYTTLCRRMQAISFDLTSHLRQHHHEGIHLLIDSTGLKVYGENEWYKKKHQLNSYSLWSKLHVAVERDSQKIVSINRSNAHAYDSKQLPLLLEPLHNINISCIYGDGAYDKRLCYEAAYQHNAQLIVPVQRRARKQQNNRNYPCHPSLIDRDRKIAFIREFENEEQGRKIWKIVSRYHQRSLVETAIFRLKQNFGDRLQCHKNQHQQKQMEARAYALNIMTNTGMPLSVAV